MICSSITISISISWLKLLIPTSMPSISSSGLSIVFPCGARIILYRLTVSFSLLKFSNGKSRRQWRKKIMAWACYSSNCGTIMQKTRYGQTFNELSWKGFVKSQRFLCWLVCQGQQQSRHRNVLQIWLSNLPNSHQIL